MIAITRNAAISESTRSNCFDRGVVAVASIGDMSNFLEPAYFEGPPRLVKIDP
jgi:hypothetical protein